MILPFQSVLSCDRTPFTLLPSSPKFILVDISFCLCKGMLYIFNAVISVQHSQASSCQKKRGLQRLVLGIKKWMHYFSFDCLIIICMCVRRQRTNTCTTIWVNVLMDVLFIIKRSVKCSFLFLIVFESDQNFVAANLKMYVEGQTSEDLNFEAPGLNNGLELLSQFMYIGGLPNDFPIEKFTQKWVSKTLCCFHFWSSLPPLLSLWLPLLLSLCSFLSMLQTFSFISLRLSVCFFRKLSFSQLFLEPGLLNSTYFKGLMTFKFQGRSRVKNRKLSFFWPFWSWSFDTSNTSKVSWPPDMGRAWLTVVEFQDHSGVMFG